MSGTLFGLGLSQQVDLNGRPMQGCLLYIYQANSNTPQTAFKDVALTVGQEHPWPIVADANGRIPAFWLADGFYRARLTDTFGVVQFDIAAMVALGQSGTGTPPAPTPTELLAQTGDVKWRPTSATLSGWLRLNANKFGNTGSGGNEPGGVGTTLRSLYNFVWNNFDNTMCPVFLPGGAPTARLGTADLDFDAPHSIQLPDLRGRSPFGLDDMGNVAAGVLTPVVFSQGGPTTIGGKGGSVNRVLTQAMLPNCSFTRTGATALSGLVGKHSDLSSNTAQFAAPGTGFAVGYSGVFNQNVQFTYSGVTVTVDSGGSGSPVEHISPLLLGTWFIKI